MLPRGSFLVFGPTAHPTVHLLGVDELERYWARCKIVDKHGSASALQLNMKVTFGQPNAIYALPAWSPEAMSQTATQYDGPYKVEVRGIAAAIALGKPFTKDADAPSDDGSGGEKVPRPGKPKGKGPSALAQLLNSEAA